MGISQIIPVLPPRQAHTITWPRAVTTLSGGAAELRGWDKNALGSNSAVQLFSTNAGTANTKLGDQYSVALTNNLWAMQRTLNFPLNTTIVQGSFGPGYVTQEMYRVWRCKFRIAYDGAASAGNSGVWFRPDFDAGEWPDGGFSGFGIVGSTTAGQWRYLSTNNSAFPGNIVESIDISTAIVPSFSDFSLMEFQIINSGPGREATLEVFVNAQPIFTSPRTWASGDLIGYDGGNDVFFRAGFREDNSGGSLYIAPFEVFFGKFTRTGVEITN